MSNLKHALLFRWRAYFPRLYALSMFLRHYYRDNSYCNITGYISSLEQSSPVDVDGEPVPWFNYNAISFLRERLRSDMDVFEYGCGNSTLFFGKRTRSVLSIEHNFAWGDRVRSNAPSNVRIKMIRDVGRAYSESIVETGKRYDLVIIDGKERVACFKAALNCLAETGVLILDDAQQSDYREVFDLARSRGFRWLSFEGLKPGGFTLDSTAFFYRDANCMGV